MTRQKKVDLGSVADRELRRRGFRYMMSSRTPAKAAGLRESFGRMLQNQLPDGTYVYVIIGEKVKYQGKEYPVYQITKYENSPD